MKQHLLGILLAVAACFTSLPTTYAQTDGDIVDRLNKALLVKLPAEFEAKVKEFAANDTIMRTRSATAFTEQFIIEQFKKDWGIDRQNQLLFIWSTIYSGITKKTLYDFLDDDNEARSDEYFNQLENINKFYESYKKGFKEYMEQKSAEYDRMIAEAKRQSAEALTSSLKEVVWFFNRVHMKDKQAILPNEIEEAKNLALHIFTRCKELNINYEAILRNELGDDKKVQELLKFYGVE
ncbi:MAG: hypothetical protein II950_06755 [Prevotella sp.]|nr:hypothetical protein [Prevotella sp.]